MAINFSVGNYVVPNDAFIKGGLQYQTKTPQLMQTLITLGNLSQVPCRVVSTGSVDLPQSSFIRLLPVDTSSICYNEGDGVAVYFSSDTLLNNSFELSTGFIPDNIVIRCLNNSGSTISKGAVIRQTGFNTSQQVPTIDLADASTIGTSAVLGVTSESISNNAVGAVIVAGSFQADTSSFSLNDNAYLSDTAGAISTTAGTVTVAVGRVLSVGEEGSVAISGNFSPSGAGASGISGNLGANDMRAARADGTSGNSIQGSNVIIWDGGQINWPNGLGSIGHILGPDDAALNVSAPNKGRSVNIYGGNPQSTGDAGSVWLWGGQATSTGAEAGWVGLYPGWGDADAGGGSVEIMMSGGNPPGSCKVILGEDYSGDGNHGNFEIEDYDFETSLFKVDTNGITLKGGPKIVTGTGSPESSVTAPVGSLFLRTDGGEGSTLYVKESGSGNTGWAAK